MKAQDSRLLRQVVLVSFGLSLAFRAERAFAESPPVDVHIAEDDDEDFFSDSKAKKKVEEPREEKSADESASDEGDKPKDRGAKEEVKKHADELFDELNAAEKGVTVKKKRGRQSADNENTNTQVVNVVVVGEKDTKSIASGKADNEAKQQNVNKDVPPAQGGVTVPTPPPVPQVPRTTRETIDRPLTVRRAPPPPPGPPVHHDYWSDWWERPSMLEAGDVMVFYSVGGYGGGLYQGLGFEGLFASWGGLRLSAHGDFFNHDTQGRDWDESNSNWGFFVGGRSPTPPVSGHVSSAFVHMEDLAFALHFGSQHHGLDLSPSIGLSHFGYSIDSTDQGTQRGGAGFVRVGAALSYFYKRFFAGIDVGWYPWQIFNYTIDLRPETRDTGVAFKDFGNAYDSHRVSIAGHVGLNF
jgi:hypothetical protein